MNKLKEKLKKINWWMVITIYIIFALCIGTAKSKIIFAEEEEEKPEEPKTQETTEININIDETKTAEAVQEIKEAVKIQGEKIEALTTVLTPTEEENNLETETQSSVLPLYMYTPVNKRKK